MAQHKASDLKTLESALRNKKAAAAVLNELSGLSSAIATAQAKIDADADLTWDTDYVATAGTDLFDTDVVINAQYQRSLREVMINSLAHKALANKLCDALEEASVSMNAVLAQMDADGGTLSDDATYEAYRITDLVGAEEISGGQHKATDKQSLRSALSHKELADKIIADLKANQEAVNAMIDSIQAANA